MNSEIIVGKIIFNPKIHLFLYLNLTTQEIVHYKLMLDNDILLYSESSDNDRLSGDQKIILQSILQTFQELLILELIQTDSRALRRWRKTLPENFRRISKKKRSQNLQFQQLLFESYFFQERIESILPKVISKYATSQTDCFCQKNLETFIIIV